MSESYVVKNALIPCDGWCAPRNVLIRDGVIAAVEAPDGVPLPPPQLDESRTTLECASETRLLMPGLHNAHSHSSNFFNKGSMAQLPLEMMAACRANLPEDHPWKNGRRSAESIIERYRLGALAIGLHNLMSGATSVIDMIALPDADENGDDEMAFLCLAAASQGYQQSGVRVFLGPHLMDSGDVDGYSGYASNFLALVPEDLRDDAETTMKEKNLKGLGADGMLRRERAPTDPKLTARALSLWRRAIKDLHRPDKGVHIILSPHNELTCSEELYKGCAAIMREFDDVHATTHLLEGLHQPIGGGPHPDDPDAVSRSVKVLDECGFLTPRTTLAHCVHLTKGDMELLARRGCLVSHNPVSNLRLGAGIADVLAMKSAGVNVGIGVDGAGSGADDQDVLGAAKLACMLPNVKTSEYRDWLKPREVLLGMGCRCGRQAVGLCSQSPVSLAPAGSGDMSDADDQLISPGQVADLVLYDLTALSVLPRADPFTSILLSGGRPSGPGAGPQIDCAWVNGKQVLARGDSITVDIANVRREILAAGDSVYPPANVPPNNTSPFEVEYRAAVNLPL